MSPPLKLMGMDQRSIIAMVSFINIQSPGPKFQVLTASLCIHQDLRYHLVDEGDHKGRGANTMTSFLYHHIQYHGYGEERVNLHMDNCFGQNKNNTVIWAPPSEFGTYRLCEQRRFRRACASAQSRQNLRCSLIKAVSQEEPSDRKPDP